MSKRQQRTLSQAANALSTRQYTTRLAEALARDRKLAERLPQHRRAPRRVASGERGGGRHRLGHPPEGDVACSECKEGRLECRENPRDRGVFYGSSNGPYCEQTVRRVPSAEPDCRSGRAMPSAAATAGGRSRAVPPAAAGWRPGWASTAAFWAARTTRIATTPATCGDLARELELAAGIGGFCASRRAEDPSKLAADGCGRAGPPAPPAGPDGWKRRESGGGRPVRPRPRNARNALPDGRGPGGRPPGWANAAHRLQAA